VIDEDFDEHTHPSDITRQTVGIKDIIISTGLSDAMSKQARAEGERQARIILGGPKRKSQRNLPKQAKPILVILSLSSRGG
jgi:regulator of protease activity HflC (stomatin/prohibitin superfamily)